MDLHKKYRTEFGINMFGDLCILAQQDGLVKLSDFGFNEHNPCHIYMIARRPRIMIDPTSIQIDSERVSGQFLIQDGDAIISETFVLPNNLGPNIRFDCPYA